MLSTVAALVLAVLGVAGMILLTRNYRNQRDMDEPPGKVPEDY